MKHILRHSLRRHRQQVHEDNGHPPIKKQATFEYEPHTDDDLDAEKVEEILKKFREGGRFEYNQEQKNYFDIKYW